MITFRPWPQTPGWPTPAPAPTGSTPAPAADQGADHSLQGGEWKPGERHPQRDRAGRRFKRQPGHGAQGDRRAGRPRTTWCAARQGHLRRHPRRAEDAVPLPAPDADDEPPRPRSARASTGRQPHARAADVARARTQGGDADRQLRRLLLAGDRHGARRHLAARQPSKGLTAERLGGWRGPMYGLLRSRVRRAHGPRRGKLAPWPPTPRRPRCWRCRRGRRCCRSSGCPSPTATSRSSCAAACTTGTFHYRNDAELSVPLGWAKSGAVRSAAFGLRLIQFHRYQTAHRPRLENQNRSSGTMHFADRADVPAADRRCRVHPAPRQRRR